MATTKVAIAGATGNLGLPILNKVLSAGYPVTVLTRKGSSNTSKLPQNSAITIREVDYSDVASLTSALQGINVVVSVLATAVVGGQTPLIEAAVAAGVSRFIPSEFGSNTVNPNAAQLPVFKGKVETLGVLKSKVQSNPGSFSYTQIINGPFFDWGLEHGFIINPAKHTADIYNGGDVYFSTTTLDTIGDAVVGVIRNLDKTANRPLYIQDARVTQNQLIQYAKEKDGKEWSITHKDTNKVREESFNELKKGSDGNIGAAMVGFILSAIFDPEYGSDFEGSLDNDLLGIKGYSDDEVRKLVERFL
ncbi:oxidoreductase CipA-like protein [Exophiala dermatitidis NIH/UT8656]|uniref:Oxidoreductase CipA-like protein n=2 Tax=Exophiala dermatitidis TaxID=5970 RepID=H6C1S7_EXODN|nr:oxidoreductase CipA-like protein [Exophiala dermatitidis NIH/UT8656]EHY57806.1 oxidoreductase CipA-like protein [Exophiala dermatitidis NIH/UT8656]